MVRGETKGEGEKKKSSAYRLGVQEGRMMPLTMLFLPPLLDRGETEMDAENKREG